MNVINTQQKSNFLVAILFFLRHLYVKSYFFRFSKASRKCVNIKVHKCFRFLVVKWVVLVNYIDIRLFFILSNILFFLLLYVSYLIRKTGRGEVITYWRPTPLAILYKHALAIVMNWMILFLYFKKLNTTFILHLQLEEEKY